MVQIYEATNKSKYPPETSVDLKKTRDLIYNPGINLSTLQELTKLGPRCRIDVEGDTVTLQLLRLDSIINGT